MAPTSLTKSMRCHYLTLGQYWIKCQGPSYQTEHPKTCHLLTAPTILPEKATVPYHEVNQPQLTSNMQLLELPHVKHKPNKAFAMHQCKPTERNNAKRTQLTSHQNSFKDGHHRTNIYPLVLCFKQMTITRRLNIDRVLSVVWHITRHCVHHLE